MSESPAEKQKIRQFARQKIQDISAIQREHNSALACALLQTQKLWQQSRSVFFYSPLPSELNIWALVPEALGAGKTVLLPKFDPASNSYLPYRIQDLEGDLLPGKFGINEPDGNCEPYPLKQLDLTLVPALAFDPLGNRLGRGRGFYDRLLAAVSGAKCGVAFDEQILSKVPVEPHDIPVDYVLTPTRWIVVTDAISE
ncbi:MAG: 5-formyltetrahydrofolate cyclo-ligase [Limisphaerales bacterium]